MKEPYKIEITLGKDVDDNEIAYCTLVIDHQSFRLPDKYNDGEWSAERCAELESDQLRVALNRMLKGSSKSD